MQRYDTYVRQLTNPGLAVATPTIRVKLAGTNTDAVIYADNLGTPTPKVNPFTGDADGHVFFYAPNGRYDVQVSGGTPAVTPYTIPDVSLYNATVSVKDYGARGDGVTDDTAAISLAMAAAAGGSLVFPPGSHLVTALTIPATVTVVFDRGGMLKRSAGTLTISGPIVAGPWQIFSGYTNGQVIIGNSVSGQRGRAWAGQTTYPDWWGVNGNVSPFDTNAVQCAFDAQVPTTFARDYYVTQVNLVFNSGALPNATDMVVYGQDRQLIGIASVATDCVLRISTLNLRLHDLFIQGLLGGSFNTNYQCGVHMYADAANPLVAFNYIRGLKIQNLKRGLVVGALPGGAAPYDAPVGDAIYDFETKGVEQVLHVDQPNCKMWFYSAHLLVTIVGTPWTYANSYCLRNVAIDGTGHGGAELIFNSPLIQSSDSAAAAAGIGIDGINITITDPIWEVGGKNYVRKASGAGAFGLIDQGTSVIIRGVRDGGGPADSLQDYFIVDTDARGQLVFEDCLWQLPAAAGLNPQGGVFVNARAAHPSFRTIFDSCHIREFPWSSNTGANNVDSPLVAGGQTIIRETWFQRWSGGAVAVTVDETYDMDGIGDNRLQVVANPTGNTMSTVNDQTTKQGWAYAGTVAVGNGFNRQSADLPPDTNYTATLQVTSIAGSTSAMQSPTGTNGFRVNPDIPLVLTGWLKGNTVNGLIIVDVIFYQYDGTLSAITPFEGPGPGIWRGVRGNPSLLTLWQDWTRLLVRVPVPADAQFASIILYADQGQIAKFTGLSI